MKFRLNTITTALAILASTISGYGVFYALHTLAHVPFLIAILGIALFEGAAVGFATLAIQYAKEGDNPFPWIFATVGVIIVGCIVQFSSAIVEGHGFVAGIIMAMAPIVAISLFVGEILLYLNRLGRLDGSILNPASRIPRDMRQRFPRAAAIAENFAAIDRTITAQDAMLKALEIAPPNLDSTRPVIDNPRKVSRGLTAEKVLDKAEKEVATASEGTTETVTSKAITPPQGASLNGHSADKVRISTRR